MKNEKDREERDHRGEHEGREGREGREYPETIEALLRRQPMSPLSGGGEGLRLRRLGAEISVENNNKGRG